MGLLLVFAAGYVMGSRSGGESLDDVVQAVHAIRRSDEFHDLVSAVRNHAAHSLHELATMMETGREHNDESWTPADLVDRVRLIASRRQ